ncbi:2-hydroxychromene-2-carboxylate isomerase [Roseospira marina]|uniref:2-hydroxychromene-2-carboxylate isomerase n=1 Tax=Roseospira marina TaxID=140057 RepID=A0A5M6IAT4_9PROT|nr:2-hydroxychromene-2-carboxylate isomerase [Roseospira marina]KAA5605394.1 2-hydroxychromene-2-carboxylate isomerase [Roseospira marina]MBB4314619.1 2-hydroxychromene-2-carboxylate isomerase [Roseospira marina]MBB5088776.1 2-hydroxychromene-2-carboxylate isomerase [Roseospira marina]
MSRTVTYYVFLNSPWCFMGAGRLAEIARTAGATVDVRPINLGRVFQETGGKPLAQRPQARQDYRLYELARWRRWYGLDMVEHPDVFPCDEGLAATCVLAVKAAGGDALALATGFGAALWLDNRDIGRRPIIEGVLKAQGLDAAAVLAEAEGQADRWATELQANTDAARAAGCFGVPWYVVDGEPFWGQDRLDFVAEALTRPTA